MSISPKNSITLSSTTENMVQSFLHYQTCSDILCNKVEESVLSNTLQSSTNLLQTLQEKLPEVSKEFHIETAKSLAVNIITNSSKFDLNSYIEKRLKMPANAAYPSQKLFDEFKVKKDELLLSDQENLLETSFKKITINTQQLEIMLSRRAELVFKSNQIREEIERAKRLGEKLDKVNTVLTNQLEN